MHCHKELIRAGIDLVVTLNKAGVGVGLRFEKEGVRRAFVASDLCFCFFRLS